MKNPLVYLILLLIGLYLMLNLSQSIISLTTKNKELEQANDKVEKEISRNSQLISELSKVQNPKYIEQQAREKLGMSRPGETVVVVPEEAVVQMASLTASLSADFYARFDETPNWQKWVKLFW